MRMSRAVGLGMTLFAAPGLLHAAPTSPASAPEMTGPRDIVPTVTVGPATPATGAAPVTEPTRTEVAPGPAPAPTTPVPALATKPVPAPEPEAEPEPTGPATPKPRTWQIYQRPLPGAEHSWGPPNGQMPAFAEVSETQSDPNAPPPNGTIRIVVGAVVGTLGLGVFGLGIAARVTDVFGADHRAGVPLIGGGLVTAAIGWGLFTHGMLRRQAYLRWKNSRAAVTPTLGGATFVLRF